MVIYCTKLLILSSDVHLQMVLQSIISLFSIKPVSIEKLHESFNGLFTDLNNFTAEFVTEVVVVADVEHGAGVAGEGGFEFFDAW